MKSPFQILVFVSCNSVPAGSGTLRSGHSAKTPTAQPRCSRGESIERKERKTEFHCIYLYIAVIILNIAKAAFLYGQGIFTSKKYMNHTKIFFVSDYTNNMENCGILR